MAGLKWIDRIFSFQYPVEHYPEILERLRGTPARVRDRISRIEDTGRLTRTSKGWTIQEHAGHLVSVEVLFSGRLDDYEAGLRELRAADMSNARTEQARYLEREMKGILAELAEVREETVSRLESYDPEFYSIAAYHPRLKVDMRLVDSMFFFAEHDDYHLARISEMMKDIRR